MEGVVAEPDAMPWSSATVVRKGRPEGRTDHSTGLFSMAHSEAVATDGRRRLSVTMRRHW